MAASSAGYGWNCSNKLSSAFMIEQEYSKEAANFVLIRSAWFCLCRLSWSSYSKRRSDTGNQEIDWYHVNSKQIAWPSAKTWQRSSFLLGKEAKYNILLWLQQSWWNNKSQVRVWLEISDKHNRSQKRAISYFSFLSKDHRSSHLTPYYMAG